MLSAAKALLTYSSSEHTLLLAFPPDIKLGTRDEIKGVVDAVIRETKALTDRKPIYLIVDYRNLSFKIEDNEFVRTETQRLIESANIVGVVRFGADPVMRAAARTRAMKSGVSSNLYETLDEAKAAITALKQK
jgi:hypothetical protein